MKQDPVKPVLHYSTLARSAGTNVPLLLYLVGVGMLAVLIVLNVIFRGFMPDGIWRTIPLIAWGSSVILAVVQSLSGDRREYHLVIALIGLLTGVGWYLLYTMADSLAD